MDYYFFDIHAPKICKLNVGGKKVGLAGVEQAFIDLISLELSDEKVTEKLFEIVESRNYIPKCVEREYKKALVKKYKKYKVRF